MQLLDVPAQEIRFSARISRALAEHRPVAVSRYGKRLAVVLSDEQFDLVAPLLELLEQGAAVSPELLMTVDDLELERALAGDRESTDAENAQIAELLRASSVPR